MSGNTAQPASPLCLDVPSWRIYTNEEMRNYLRMLGDKANNPKTKRGSMLAVRDRLSPVDLYCYLKARFGEPNGLQTFLAKDDSDNLFHWDYNIMVGDHYVHIYGMSREIHFMISEELCDEDWKNLIINIKKDYGRIGKQKAVIFQRLEKWVVFPNKFVEVAGVCAELHKDITDNMSNHSAFVRRKSSDTKEIDANLEIMMKANENRATFTRNCLELSLLTPVMAEAFINMVILALCKPEIRNNKRQFDAFIRSQIDTKIFDLPYKCEGFVKEIDQDSRSLRNFKRVMDKRNHAIHGNIDPEREQIETVFFEGKRPLFKETGDHIEKFIENIERQAQAEIVIQDYEDTYEFIEELATHLEPSLQPRFWRVMDDGYPGFDVNRRKVGALFPDRVMTSHMEGVRYDDELDVTW